MENKSNVVIYTTEDNEVKVKVSFIEDTAWLSQSLMAELFQSSRTNVIEHINNIYKEGELDKNSTCRNFRQVQKEGNREVERELPFYNLDMIIAVGYRVKSKIATQFRIWATERLKEYIIKGFTMDDDKLKNLGGGNYWKELLDRIKDIRSSEKVLYRQVLDLYATSSDYDPNSNLTQKFFKIVQNKLHYVVHGQTAAEVVYNRADANKEFMGLKTFAGKLPIKSEVVVAKNYLDEKELKVLNNLVSGYFDFAEIRAMEQTPTTMGNYIKQLDSILSSAGRKILSDSGKISHEQAREKAETEYRIYQEKTITDIEQAYIDSIKKLEKKVKNNC